MRAICQDMANAQVKPSASFRHRKQGLGADTPHSSIHVSHWQSASGITFLLTLMASLWVGCKHSRARAHPCLPEQADSVPREQAAMEAHGLG